MPCRLTRRVISCSHTHANSVVEKNSVVCSPLIRTGIGIQYCIRNSMLSLPLLLYLDHCLETSDSSNHRSDCCTNTYMPVHMKGAVLPPTEVDVWQDCCVQHALCQQGHERAGLGLWGRSPMDAPCTAPSQVVDKNAAGTMLKCVAVHSTCRAMKVPCDHVMSVVDQGTTANAVTRVLQSVTPSHLMLLQECYKVCVTRHTLMRTGASRLLRSFLSTHRKFISTALTCVPLACGWGWGQQQQTQKQEVSG